MVSYGSHFEERLRGCPFVSEMGRGRKYYSVDFEFLKLERKRLKENDMFQHFIETVKMKENLILDFERIYHFY